MRPLQSTAGGVYETCGGFNIEGSHVRNRERMIKTLAHGRKAVSLFKYGLGYIQ
ncbi:MAG: hypothetical protein MJY66_08040 [Bacteroidaceae bacterium]|nr:hypothetical protein [Bacteroidaceae bacterium]